MTAANVDLLQELGELIEDLTTTGKPSLDEKQIKRVKNICKTSDLYVNHVYHILITQLKKKHSEIRLSCFQIISELFTRSHAFRELLLSEFQIFLGLVVGTDANAPLPPPLTSAKTMKEKAVDAIENWYQKYGSHYKKLDLGYHYLKRVKHVEFDAIRTRSLRERRHAQDREQRKQQILQKKIDKVENEIAEQTSHIDLCITEINNCFKLLLPHPDDYEVHCLEFENQDIKAPKRGVGAKQDSTLKTQNKTPRKGETEGVVINEEGTSPKSTRQRSTESECCVIDNEVCKRDSNSEEYTDTDLVKDHGLGSRSYEINIELKKFQPSVDETEDNTIIINTVKEMHKEITYNYLPMVNQWLHVFTKAGHSHQRIRSVLDLKKQLQSAKDQFNELNISPMKSENKKEADDDDDDDGDDFEDVPEKEGIEYISEDKMAEYGLESLIKNQNNTSNDQGKNTPSQNSYQNEEVCYLKQFGFTIKDAEDPTSHARALLEARKKQTCSASNSNQVGSSTSTSSEQTLGSSNIMMSEKRKELLARAPVVAFDMDLYHWEDPNYDPPKIIRSDNYNNYWAAKDAEAEQIFEGDKGSMLKRKIAFGGKFEPVKWSCRALLPTGNLCPRKDRIKCPFHGIIIARDDKGNPVSKTNYQEGTLTTVSSPSTSTVQNKEDWKDIQQDIEAQTGIDLGKTARKQRSRKKKSGTSEKELSRKKKYARLTDIHKSNKSPRSRLEKKVLSRDAMKRVAEEMDSLATKRFLDKFGDQFNYQLKK